MKPFKLDLPLPQQSDSYYVHKISNLLSSSECEDLIQLNQRDVLSVSGGYSNRLRHLFQDGKLAEKLWQRLQPFYGDIKVTDEEGQVWVARGLNTMFRFCKYEPGGDFKPHYDGCRLADIDEQSFMTVNMYLNSVDHAHGGATRVLKIDPSVPVGGPHEVEASFQPEGGSAMVFRSDTIFHDGEALKEGVKYLLRTDVMFQRETEYDFFKANEGLNDQAKAQKMLRLAERLEDGGNPMGAIIWYKRAFRLDPVLESAR